MNTDFIIAILIGAALISLVRFMLPLYEDRGSIYKDVKQGLLLFGHAFRSDKLKNIVDIVFNIVSIVEKYDKSNITKQYEAIEMAYAELLSEFDIILDYDVVELLVEIAVSYLPPTNKVK